MLQGTADRQVEVVECSAAIEVSFADGATMITIHPYRTEGTDAVIADHSRHHPKDTVTALPLTLEM